MHSHPDIDSYFYKGDPTQEEEFMLEGDTLTIKIEESLGLVYEKTLRAFDYFIPSMSKYDFIFRTNLSSFVRMDAYIKHCETLPRQKLCSAIIGKHDDILFPAGAGFTITPDLVKRLVEERPTLTEQDDVTIGKALASWGIPIEMAHRADILASDIYMILRNNIPDKIFHFRIKQIGRHEHQIVDENELKIMDALIRTYYDTERTIQVVMRMCPDSRNVLSGDGTRPEWFSKEKCFKSMFDNKDDRTNITVLFDGDSTHHWIRNYPVEVQDFKGGDGDSSFLFQLDFMKRQMFSIEDIVYCLEDDYLHKPNWPAILREGFGSITPSSLKFDYLTLYDHNDKYTYGNEMYKTLTSRIGVTEHAHWRTIPSTTNTWSSLYKTFLHDYDVFVLFKNLDNNKFLYLGSNRGRVIGSCIPGYSTHCHTEHLSPCVDWSKQ
jgi:hypothetical protein